MKTIFITGINRGLGKALFQLFITRGYHVYGLLRNAAAAEELKKAMPSNGNIILADIGHDASIASIKEAVGETTVHLLINNAGIAGESFLLSDTAPDEVLDLFNIHCLGVLRVVKALQANLSKAEDPVVVNINSRFGSITRQSLGVYSDLDVSYSYRIAKAAQNMLTNCMKAEMGQEVTFVSLHPGRMKTDIAQTDADLDPQEVAASILQSYEKGLFEDENGIVELNKGVIEW